MDTKIMIRYKDKCVNDVPPETIVRHLSVEIGKLKAENAELRDTLRRREDAIRSFKEWQKKVTEQNVSYWLNEGIKYLDVKPDPALLKKVQAVVKQNKLLNEWVRKVDSVYHATVKAERELNEVVLPTGLEDTALILFPKVKIRGNDINEEKRLAWLEGVEYGRERNGL